MAGCRPELMVKHIPDFIKSQPFHLAAPGKLLQEAVQIFRSISESSQVFAYHNDDVRADFLCFADELQLVQASTASFIVAGYNDLFLLDRQRQRLERGILILDYGCIETIIVLPAAAALASEQMPVRHNARTLTKWRMTRASARLGLAAICHGRSFILQP